MKLITVLQILQGWKASWSLNRPSCRIWCFRKVWKVNVVLRTASFDSRPIPDRKFPRRRGSRIYEARIYIRLIYPLDRNIQISSLNKVCVFSRYKFKLLALTPICYVSMYMYLVHWDDCALNVSHLAWFYCASYLTLLLYLNGSLASLNPKFT